MERQLISYTIDTNSRVVIFSLPFETLIKRNCGGIIIPQELIDQVKRNSEDALMGLEDYESGTIN